MSTSQKTAKKVVATTAKKTVRAARPSRSKTAVAARVAAKTTAKATPKTVQAPLPVKEVFSTDAQEAHRVEVPAGNVALFINGTSRGLKQPGNTKLIDFVRGECNNAGIRTFSVYLDGAKATTAQGNDTLAGVSKVEIISKDARG